MKQISHFIDGASVPSASGRSFDKRSPLNNAVIARVAEGGQAEVDAAVRAARAALHGPWGRMTTDQRVAMLHAVADGITQIGRAHV